MSVFRRRLFLANFAQKPNTFVFRINPTPADAIVVLNDTTTNTITVNKGDSVSWSVAKDGYISQNGIEENINSNITKDIVLEEGIKEYIQFADPEVERICIENWSSDGIGLTVQDAEKVTSFQKKFKGNTTITSFDELQYFRNVILSGGYAASDFDSCSSLQSVKFPNNINKLPSYLFRDCTSLASVNLENITVLENGVFEKASALYLDVSLLSNYTSIGERCFNACTNVFGDLYLPKLTGVLGLGAFYGTNINKVLDLGNITSLKYNSGLGCFMRCKELTYAKIPQTVTEIQQWAFYEASKLATLICMPTTPPTIGTAILGGTSPDLLIYVPDESIGAYKIATGWIDYADKIRPISEYVEPTN